MEKGLQRIASPHAPTLAQPNPVAPTPAPTPTQDAANDPTYLPSQVANDSVYRAPLHTHMQSTLAPTSEYVRYLLLALPARYVPRGIIGTLFETDAFSGNRFAKKLTDFSERMRGKLSINKTQANHTAAMLYNAIMGVGSLAMTVSYSRTVYKDIRNIFAETVGDELGKPAENISWSDLKRSDNRIVKKTMENFLWRSFKRGITDIFFFPAAALRNAGLGDLMVGTKALQAFSETWKRKTTMFEDLVTFINNKINPRNGLGQAIGVGEVFDLYQHYTEAFHPEQMFTNVVERGTGEGARWAQSQPIFERLAELMNLTYAYKHSSVLDPQTGHAIHLANFALPKFIYLLGHDLINVRQPERTLLTIEIANQFGISAVKQMQTMLAGGATLEQVATRYPLPEVQPHLKSKPENGKNAVIAKGSTRQLGVADDAIPATTIDATSAEPALPGMQAAIPQSALG